MKKRLVMLVLAVSMTLGMTACTGKESTKAVVNEENEDKPKKNDEVVVGEEEKEEQEEKTADPGKMPTLGVDDKGYKGFKYLEAHKLDTGEAKAIVYVPVSDYVYESNGTVSAEKLGVTVEIELDPYIQWHQEEFTMEENLKEYTESRYKFDEFYTIDHKDAEISEINAISKEAATLTASHLEYDEYNEEYYYIWNFYYLMKTDDDRIFIVEVEVDSLNTTGYTEDLMAELEAYLGIDMGYDEDALLAKIDAYDPSEEGNVYSTGYWIFELPDGWGEDKSYEDSYDEYVYAPEGDAGSSNCIIYITDEYVGEDTGYIREIDDDEVIRVLKEFMPEDIENVKCEVVGETAVGYALKSCFEAEGIRVEMYFIFEGYNTYTIMAMQDDDGTEAFEAAEQIVNTAKTR